jgi:ATP-dependent helicase HrpA
MAGELVETSRLWGRDVARIQPEWAEDVGAHLVKRTYSEPSWSSKRGAATAREKVLLFGVPLVADRQVLYAHVDRESARELFIRHALVEGDWSTHHAFWAANRSTVEEAEELEARSRQRGLVVDDDVLFDFYDARVPDSVVSARHFDQWWKTARRRDPELLTFSLDLLVPEADEIDTDAFPTLWPQGEVELPLTYQFSPGTDADGLTVHIPITVLNRVVPDGFDWMVPGLLDELTVATIRSLPKAVRVQLVPAPDVGRDVAAWLRANTPEWADVARAGDMAEPFRTSFARAVRELRDVVVPDDAWDGQAERLPAHLRATFRVTSAPERGVATVLGEGADLAGLKRRLAPKAEAAVRTAVRAALDAARAANPVSEREGSGDHPRSDTPKGLSEAQGSGDRPRSDTTLVREIARLSTWPGAEAGLTDGALPEVVETPLGAGTVVRGYPALVEEQGPKGERVIALRVLADAVTRDAQHARGVQLLLLSEVALATGRVTTRWSGKQALTLAASPYRSTEALVADAQLAAVVALTSGGTHARTGTELPDAARIRDASAYAAARTLLRDRLEDEVHTVVGHVVAVLAADRTLDGEIRAATSLSLLNTLSDLRDQVGALVHDGFVSATPTARLPQLTRYVRAASYRLEKAQSNPHRDAELAWRVHDVEQAYERARAAYAKGRPDPARAANLADVRWQIEELRVSLFAQQLGTDGTVSEKRIRKALDPAGW